MERNLGRDLGHGMGRGAAPAEVNPPGTIWRLARCRRIIAHDPTA
jgi:hypothetical protein